VKNKVASAATQIFGGFLKVGAEFEGTARDLTSEGQAVVSAPNGQTVFVSGLWLGETGRIKVTMLKGRVGFGELVGVSHPVEARRDAPCVYHGADKSRCGGCPWMYVDYSAQLLAKQQRVNTAFERLDPRFSVNQIWASEYELGYRNRVQLKTNGQVLGFIASKTNNLVDIDDCLVLSDANRFSLKKLRASLPNSEWKPSRSQKWTTLDLDENTTAAEVSVNQRLAFQQANTSQNIRMQTWLRAKLAEVKSTGKVIELFCGSGNFTKVLSESGCEDIVAVEGQQEALDTLQQLDLNGVETHCVNLFEEASVAKILKQHRDASTLILDPPREGFRHSRLMADKKNKFKNVLYISCDLATLVRDLKHFLDSGFKLAEVQPLDQFPQTAHLEILCHLKR